MQDGIIPRRMAKDTPLLDVSEARQRLLAHFTPLESIEIPLASAVGRVLARDVSTSTPLPPFNNSSMDGFAVRAVDLDGVSETSPVRLEVIEDIPAGKKPARTIGLHQAARIMTGAMLPGGADAVVPVEHTDFTLRQAGVPAPKTVLVERAVQVGDNIRLAGSDVLVGTTVQKAGQLIRPQDAGLLSMIGAWQVPVWRKPRVAIFSSGDELVSVEQELKPGQIHDSNTYTLIGQVEACGAEAVNFGIVADTPQAVQDVLEKAQEMNVDLVISSAGVSVGALDFVRLVIEQEGELEFWRVNMRPGKPFMFGNYRGAPFIGLPGNPVSAFVAFEVFVRPVLLTMVGRSDLQRTSITTRLLHAVGSDGRESYLRAIVSRENGEYTAQLAGNQSSGNLFALVQANALLIIPSGVKSVPSGGQAQAWLLDGSA
jgi:molybdopterin molybdotransferase